MKNLATVRPLYKGNPESPLGNLTADGLVWMAQKYRNVDADVSIYNSGGIRNSFNKGDITLEDVYAVYPFDNVLTILTIIWRTLENMVLTNTLPALTALSTYETTFGEYIKHLSEENEGSITASTDGRVKYE